MVQVQSGLHELFPFRVCAGSEVADRDPEPAWTAFFADCEARLIAWRAELSRVRLDYPLLLLLPSRKLHRLAADLFEEKFGAVLAHLAFVFPNAGLSEADVRKARDQAKKAASARKKDQAGRVRRVGELLSELHKRAPKSAPAGAAPAMLDQRLHAIVQADGLAPADFVRLVLALFPDRLPEPCELLWAEPDTPLEELQLFCQRAQEEIFQGRRFVVVGANRLSLDVQSWLVDFNQKQALDETLRSPLWLVVTGPSNLRETAALSAVDGSRLLLDDRAMRARLREAPAFKAAVRRVVYVTGRAGNGKSHRVRKEMGARPHVTLCVHEALSLASLIEQLEQARAEGRRCVHLDVSGYAPMPALHRVLWSLLVFGALEDPRTGRAVVLDSHGGSACWDFFVELPSYGPGRTASDPDWSVDGKLSEAKEGKEDGSEAVWKRYVGSDLGLQCSWPSASASRSAAAAGQKTRLS
jgi:hypothetical protein